MTKQQNPQRTTTHLLQPMTPIPTPAASRARPLTSAPNIPPHPPGQKNPPPAIDPTKDPPLPAPNNTPRNRAPHPPIPSAHNPPPPPSTPSPPNQPLRPLLRTQSSSPRRPSPAQPPSNPTAAYAMAPSRTIDEQALPTPHGILLRRSAQLSSALTAVRRRHARK